MLAKRGPSPLPPLWVALLYRLLDWVDSHPLYLLPERWRFWRFRLADDACGCEYCERRRKEGRQGPRRWGK